MNIAKISGGFLLLMMFSGCSGAKSSQSVCTVEYHFRNPSLGPVNGKQDVKIKLQDRKLISAVDLHTQHPINPKKIRGYGLLVRALDHDTKGLEVSFDSKGFPVTIRRPVDHKKRGGSFVITLDHYYCQ